MIAGSTEASKLDCAVLTSVLNCYACINAGSQILDNPSQQGAKRYHVLLKCNLIDYD
ncbi:Protein of unknown function [Magnetospira sp. QH-2]|nr:Protein of unknown function [Magnetospira sp. QH-2]